MDPLADDPGRREVRTECDPTERMTASVSSRNDHGDLTSTFGAQVSADKMLDMQPGGFIVGQSVAVRAASQIYHHLGQYQQTRVFMPPRAAIAEVVEALAQTPLTDQEVALLVELTDEDLPERIEDRLKDTRLWHLLQVLRQNDVRVLTYVMALLMIVQLISDRNPPKQTPVSPPVVPNVTVVVQMPTDEIVNEIEQRLRDQSAESGPKASVSLPANEPSPSSSPQPAKSTKSSEQ
jgi:hypothetical protein